VQIAGEVSARYELALSLRLKARLNQSETEAAQAQALLDELKVTRVPDVPVD
jgi:hypothetical protein